MRLSLSKSDLLLLIVAIISLSGITMLSIMDWTRTDQARRRSLAARLAFRDTETLITTLLDAETGTRGYLLTSNRSYLQPYTDAVRDMPAILKSFQETSTGTQANAKDVADVVQVVHAELREMANMLAAFENRGQAGAMDVIRTNAGSDLMDEARTKCNRLKDSEFAMVTENSRSNEARKRLYTYLMAGGGVAILMILIIATMRLNAAFDRSEVLLEKLTVRTKEYQDLASRLQTVREEERAYLAREIHDELGQLLTAIKIDLATIGRAIKRGDTAAALSKAETGVAYVDDGIRSIRRIATALRPAVLDHLGLCAALEWQTGEIKTRTGMDVRFIAPAEEPALDPEKTTALFRIAQEALTNVVRHARATSAEVELSSGNQGIGLRVQDNGVGLTPEARKNSLGIIGMRERARLIGADFDVTSTPGHGTRIDVRVIGSV